MGCGTQETFRSCSDISISPNPLLKNAVNVKTTLQRISSTMIDEDSGTFFSMTDENELDENPLTIKNGALGKALQKIKEQVEKGIRLQLPEVKKDERRKNQLTQTWELLESKVQRILSNRH